MDVTAQTDEQIVRALAAGDRAALAQVFDRHAATMTRYVWAIVDDRHDVEEVVQDAFLLLWQRAETLDLPAESLLPWLLVVCRNLARNAGRKRLRHRADELPEMLAAPVEHSDAVETLRWVRSEIAALPELDRRICELCLLEGRSYAEAAETLGLTVGAVTQRVSRNRRRLKKVVMHDGH
ncbi:sigma-70 family RNA polymerase sigma factor [Curtobacterium sp. SGAir0471]|uniref:RNA polymerase sigma factor n=1 Tax=Curtobacterium sp. SGAir0471 TaxID=2070337 RepID=UPI0010CD04AE|nr:sigma-70 family RNA polymerase sigma factor [Curtobacterium sp. SGAir0471]QCR42410.1 sigma-70 family RNA polymerase sigma factor [Curtobacterium sp. SGAir0471]